MDRFTVVLPIDLPRGNRLFAALGVRLLPPFSVKHFAVVNCRVSTIYSLSMPSHADPRGKAAKFVAANCSRSSTPTPDVNNVAWRASKLISYLSELLAVCKCGSNAFTLSARVRAIRPYRLLWSNVLSLPPPTHRSTIPPLQAGASVFVAIKICPSVHFGTLTCVYDLYPHYLSPVLSLSSTLQNVCIY